MRNQTDLRAKFVGGLIGSALGDAIGEMAFGGFSESGLREQIMKSQALRYTDDTAMAIGLAESITQQGELDPQHLGDTFRANFNREPWRGYAIGPPTIFKQVQKKGGSYQDAASSLFGGSGSFGNGASMRIAPVGLFFHDASDLYEQVRTSATVTHAHPIGIDGAAVLARAIAEAVKLDPQAPFPLEQFWQALSDFARTPEIQDKLKLARELLAQDVPAYEANEQLGPSVAAHESVPYAIYAFLRQPESFEACLFYAVMHGGDRDTLGAMACAISGAYLGREAIPQAWQDRLENGQTIEELALKLAEMHEG